MTRIAVFLIFLAVGVGIWLLLSPQPKVTAPEVTARAWVKIFPDDQAHLIKDRFTLNSALRSPEIAELSIVREQFDPVGWLEKEIKVEVTKETIEISLSGRYRLDELQKLVNAVVQAYRDCLFHDEKREMQRKEWKNLKKKKDFKNIIRPSSR